MQHSSLRINDSTFCKSGRGRNALPLCHDYSIKPRYTVRDCHYFYASVTPREKINAEHIDVHHTITCMDGIRPNQHGREQHEAHRCAENARLLPYSEVNRPFWVVTHLQDADKEDVCTKLVRKTNEKRMLEYAFACIDIDTSSALLGLLRLVEQELKYWLDLDKLEEREVNRDSLWSQRSS